MPWGLVAWSFSQTCEPAFLGLLIVGGFAGVVLEPLTLEMGFRGSVTECIGKHLRNGIFKMSWKTFRPLLGVRNVLRLSLIKRWDA